MHTNLVIHGRTEFYEPQGGVEFVMYLTAVDTVVGKEWEGAGGSGQWAGRGMCRVLRVHVYVGAIEWGRIGIMVGGMMLKSKVRSKSRAQVFDPRPTSAFWSNFASLSADTSMVRSPRYFSIKLRGARRGEEARGGARSTRSVSMMV